VVVVVAEVEAVAVVEEEDAGEAVVGVEAAEEVTVKATPRLVREVAKTKITIGTEIAEDEATEEMTVAEVAVKAVERTDAGTTTTRTREARIRHSPLRRFHQRKSNVWKRKSGRLRKRRLSANA
jgi:hypothetical protein